MQFAFLEQARSPPRPLISAQSFLGNSPYVVIGRSGIWDDQIAVLSPAFNVEQGIRGGEIRPCVNTIEKKL